MQGLRLGAIEAEPTTSRELKRRLRQIPARPGRVPSRASHLRHLLGHMKEQVAITLFHPA
jgi:hypothetical protein